MLIITVMKQRSLSESLNYSVEQFANSDSFNSEASDVNESLNHSRDIFINVNLVSEVVSH